MGLWFQGFQVKHEIIVPYQFWYVKAWLYHTYKWKMYSYCMRNLIWKFWQNCWIYHLCCSLLFDKDLGSYVGENLQSSLGSLIMWQNLDIFSIQMCPIYNSQSNYSPGLDSSLHLWYLLSILTSPLTTELSFMNNGRCMQWWSVISQNYGEFAWCLITHLIKFVKSDKVGQFVGSSSKASFPCAYTCRTNAEWRYVAI